jgi:hypothetical protein
MSSRDRNRLLKVQDRERTIQRAVSRVDRDESGMCGRLGVCCSPFTFIFGIVFFILSLILMISLMLTLADKLLNIEANNLGWEDRYDTYLFRTRMSAMCWHVLSNPLPHMFSLCTPPPRSTLQLLTTSKQ